MSNQSVDNKHVLVSAVNFSVFRFLFGILMIHQVITLVPHIHDLSQSTYVFHYPYLAFVEAWSHSLIDTLQYVSLIAAVFLALGILPRLAAGIFLFAFGYLFLIDMSYYNNHYYLWCLFAFLFVIADTHHAISIFDVIKKNWHKQMDIKNYIIFGLLISIVYFYAAVAKVNADWLQGYPMRLLAKSRGYIFPDEMGYIMSYGGLFFDAIVPFILWRRPLAFYVIVPYVIFHVSNFFVFNIGIFPFVMIAGIFIYITLSKKSFDELRQGLSFSPNFVNIVYVLFFVFQVLFPLRCYLLIDGNIAWNRQGHYFAWRMMLHNHEPKYFQYFVEFPDNPESNYYINFQKLITPRQWHNTFNDPYFIWSLAQKIKKDAVKKYKTQRVKVFAKSVVQLNQHNEQDLINETIDLSITPYHLIAKNEFINPFKN